jgi:hypothetical protein
VAEDAYCLSVTNIGRNPVRLTKTFFFTETGERIHIYNWHGETLPLTLDVGACADIKWPLGFTFKELNRYAQFDSKYSPRFLVAAGVTDALGRDWATAFPGSQERRSILGFRRRFIPPKHEIQMRNLPPRFAEMLAERVLEQQRDD